MGILSTSVKQESDPTLDAVRKAIEAGEDDMARKPRSYLGASSIGQPCHRRIWLGFRWSVFRKIEAKGSLAINDGHRGEDVMADLLRRVPGITLWTTDPHSDDNTKQIGFLDAHFGGNLDGVINGLLQAPKTPHVWENKVCNEKKLAALSKFKADLGEKAALKAWDVVYYAQAQVYMKALGLTRHYMTVCAPGVRDFISVRTDYEAIEAERYWALAHSLSVTDTSPIKLSENPTWFECKFCDFHGICHAKEFPNRNCRTCASSTALPDGTWRCELLSKPLLPEDQMKGCNKHRYNPSMLSGRKPVDFNEETMEVTYDDGFIDKDQP